MKTIKKNKWLWVCFFLSILGFIFPFLIRTANDSVASILSVSLAMVGTVATVATLIIAVQLYDRFGLEGKFIEKQLDKVLELADSLKGKVIKIKMETGEVYFMRPHQIQLQDALIVPEYAENCKKIILLKQDDYHSGTNYIFDLRRSYWLPTSIKDKMKFLTIYTLRKVDVIPQGKHVKLNFNTNWEGDWMVSRPEITLEQFNTGLFELVKELEDWIKEHSTVSIDLKLDEPN